MFYVIYTQELKPQCEYFETMEQALLGIQNILHHDIYVKAEEIILIEGTRKWFSVDKEVTYNVRLESDDEL